MMYTSYGTVFVDGLGDMFGLESEEIESIGTVPVEVKLSLIFDD